MIVSDDFKRRLSCRKFIVLLLLNALGFYALNKTLITGEQWVSLAVASLFTYCGADAVIKNKMLRGKDDV